MNHQYMNDTLSFIIYRPTYPINGMISVAIGTIGSILEAMKAGAMRGTRLHSD